MSRAGPELMAPFRRMVAGMLLRVDFPELLLEVAELTWRRGLRLAGPSGAGSAGGRRVGLPVVLAQHAQHGRR
jgi:hypothetical protein